MPSSGLSRRQFLGNCCAAVTATSLFSTLTQLRVLGALAKSDASYGPNLVGASADYRALVCLFLLGGNDSNNVIIPNDTGSYASYAASRGVLALAQDKLLAIAPKTADGRTWGLHPSLGVDLANTTGGGGLKQLFDNGKMAMLANAGTLLYPTTKQQYTAASIPLPPQLYSHNDQQIEWQSSLPDQPFTTGWGGRLADLTNAFNTNNAISMSISLAGQNAFQVGRSVSQYSVSPSGAILLAGSSTNTATAAGVRTAALNDLIAGSGGDLLQDAYSGIAHSAVSHSGLLATTLAGSDPFKTAFPTSNLGQQMRIIARMVAAAPSLNLKRQIFFARVGGFDLHDGQVVATDTSTGAHANLLADVSSSVKAFYDATVEMGVANQVTTFSVSDFGRTYNSNGRGSDHGWGSHHFIVGGAVNGGNLYGQMPDLTIGGPDDTGRGRWIPTTSVDEYSARLALWFGVSPTDLPTVLPNIGRFNYARPELNFI